LELDGIPAFSTVKRTSQQFPIMPRLLSTLLVLGSALLAHAGVQQIDFTGVGHIHVLKSADWRTATPKQKVGCLDDHGKFVSENTTECGTFSRLNDYPYTLSSKHGNCTFEDDTQERNKDSVYGGNDYAWNCKAEHKGEIYDELYTIASLALAVTLDHRTNNHRTVSLTSSSASAT
jgi:hypothetical protein